jgi:(p)ppGpp synthase/HD superfamily hydrolase
MISDQFITAVKLALELHRGHLRKSSEIWYISHLFAVAGMVLELGGTSAQACAAMLHDAIEDLDADNARARILQELDQEVLDLVEELTETDIEPKPPWRGRKLIYVDHVEVMTLGALLIAVPDKLHNARTQLRDLRLDPNMWSRFNAGASDQQWWYETLIAAFRKRADELQAPPLLYVLIDELEQVTGELFETEAV